jgi:hypothetical protein
LTNGVMNILILALLCGFMIDPVMAAVQPFVYPAFRWVVNKLDGSQDIVIVRRTVKASLTGADATLDAGPKAIDAGKALEFSFGLNYAIGLGLISETDLNNFRQRYLYPSQLLLNVAVAFAFFLVCFVVYIGGQRHDGARTWYFVHHQDALGWAGVVYAAMSLWILWLSFKQYDSYRNGLSALIDGRRERQIEDARKQAQAKPTKLASGSDDRTDANRP